MPERYEPQTFEQKWRDRWNQAELFKTRTDSSRPKFYGLDFFPYPSGAGLSVGHCRNYVPNDVICRVKFMQGHNVLHPMGFDAFGLPAENEAIAKQTHPASMVQAYGMNYKRQMDLVGISYDWSRSFFSSDPTYYKWTQWIFELLYKKGLAYRKPASVNWCPKDATVLADEEVEAGRCWRCGTLVEKKWIPQWYFKITAYAQRLLDDLETIDWPEGIKALQRNWIGRSEGVEFNMEILGGRSPQIAQDLTDPDFIVKSPEERKMFLRVFTTRIDTIFGMTFAVLAPEHPLLNDILRLVPEENRVAVVAYQAASRELSEIDRQSTVREKTGVFSGAYCLNPATGNPIPLFVADYVLMGYGTGAIMAVPGHDQRDFEFALKFGLEVVPVIKPDEGYLRGCAENLDGFNYEAALESYSRNPNSFNPVFASKESTLINSGEYDGLTVSESQESLTKWMEALGIGQAVINFKLRDWLISRQRYWGCPIPIVHTANGEMELVPEVDLPVELPNVDHYEPSGDGSSPLGKIDSFVNVTTSEGTLGRRETDTMGGFACSSWYFLRFIDPFNQNEAWDVNKANEWMPVDCYVGGAEHATMHLLYARFWTKVLHDEGLVNVSEPFQKLVNQGQVLAQTPYRKPFAGEKLQVGEDGILLSFAEADEIKKKIESGELPDDTLFYRWARMSKSKGNVVTPDEMVEEFGADALRIYELFVAPFEADVQWNNDGVAGASRFLNRVFRLIHTIQPYFEPNWEALIGLESLEGTALNVRRAVHRLIKRATEDIERFAFNTYVSEMMIALNEINENLKSLDLESRETTLVLSEAAQIFITILAPAAPFSADELWESLGKSGFTYHLQWPSFDPEIAKEQTVTIAVQVNGKLRDTIEMPADATNEELERVALASNKVSAHREGKELRKIIVVPGKLVNIVVA